MIASRSYIFIAMPIFPLFDANFVFYFLILRENLMLFLLNMEKTIFPFNFKQGRWDRNMW